MAGKSQLPLILFSGMGADASVFRPQQQALGNIVVPTWPRPDADESWEAYCTRLAAAIDPGGPCIVGGASFGGLVALEVARRVDARACILIGSVRSPRQMPATIRCWRPLRHLLRFVPIGLFQRSLSLLIRPTRLLLGLHYAELLRQFCRADAELLRWSARQLLLWPGTTCPVPVYHIHGQRDRVFPIRLTTPDEVVAGGGHVISLTHPREVTAFLRSHRE
jgi:pimeloyl-ACP methyl ester carboxylesterase